MAQAERDVDVAEAAVERACQAIYREFEGYWPSNVERAHIRAALGSTIEVDWQAENERLRGIIRRALHELNPPAFYGEGSVWNDMLETLPEPGAGEGHD